MRPVPSLLAAASLAAPIAAPASAPRAIAVPEAALVEEAFSLASAVGDAVWPGWGAAPFDLVLVADDTEYLVRSEQRPEGFAPLAGTTLGGGPVLARPRTFAPALLAAFPAFGGAPVIVVGTPPATGRDPGRWVLSVLHEHFHQLQDRAYLDFQLWQEGIARYVELRVAEAFAARAAPGALVSASTAVDVRRTVLASLRDDGLEERRREAFYAFGAALGLLLDEDRPGWKDAYFRERFSLSRLSGASCPS
jgi:hypothetical protein